MTKQKKLIVILAAIVPLGLFFRGYKFPNIPNAINRDEAAIGYNAYSLIKTQKDEWGVRLPIVFKSFGDYKLAGYIYADIPFVMVFGLTPIAVRLPSLIAGVFLPLAVFWLILEITKKRTFAVMAAFVTAITPWAIFYGRVGFEANVAMLLFVLSLTLFLGSIHRQKSILLAPAALLFFLSLLTYNTPLLLAPFFIFILLIIYRRKAVISSVVIGIIACTSFLLIMPAIKGKSSVTLFSDMTSLAVLRDQRVNAKSPIERIQSSRLYFFGSIVARNYSLSFLPEFLVVQGGPNPWHQAPYTSHFTWSLYALSVIGVVIAIRRHKKQDILLLFFFVIGPIPSAVTIDAPHATRSLLFLLMLCVFAAYALVEIWYRRNVLGYLCIGIVLIESMWYLQRYEAGFTQQNEIEWNVNVGEAIDQANQIAKDRNIPITMVGDTNYTYILPLFYRRIDPELFRSTVERYPADVLGLSRVKSFGNYRFVDDSRYAEAGSLVVQSDDHGSFTLKINSGPVQNVKQK